MLALLPFSATLVFLSTGVDVDGATRSYYTCPERFFRAGNSCYHVANEQVPWREAHFACQDMQRGSSLAVLDKKIEDKHLRFKLNRRKNNKKGELWVGGSYDWGRKRWMWVNDKMVRYQAFSRRDPNDNLRWSCIILDPHNRHRWGARSCLENKRYVCQTPLREITVDTRDAIPGRRVKRTQCPERFFLAGDWCYHISRERVNWREANFKCKESWGGSLVIVDTETDDRHFRAALQNRRRAMEESWLGGIYDWGRGLWLWGYTGCSIWNQNFLRNKTHMESYNSARDWQCLTIDPYQNFRWGAQNCHEERTYICEVPPERRKEDRRGQIRRLPAKQRDRGHRQCPTENETF